MSPLARITVALAFMASGLAASRVDAFPSQRVHDRLWAKAQPWMTIDLPGGTDWQWVWVHATNVNATCDDQVPGRNEPLCSTPDHGFNVHAFVDGVGEVQGPQMCVNADCWHFWWIPPGVTRVGLLVHGTHDTRGLVSGNVDLYANNTWRSSVPLSFSGDIVLDVTAPPHGFDVETVLVPDGPILDPGGGPARPGNGANDFLGADATEVWVLAADGMMVRADTSLTGVGFAGRLGWASFNWQPYHTVVIRPWARPPSGFAVVVNGATQSWPSPPDAPSTVGVGRMRAILNDHHGYDLDGDGLSSSVEAEIGTCNGGNRSAGVVACIHADTFNANRDAAFMDPRDTDGDGISDFAEVIGSDIAIGREPRANGSCGDPSNMPTTWYGANQTLPLWGFNPIHKDALIEIDMGPQNGGVACPAIGMPDTLCNTFGGQRYAVPPMGAATLSDYLGAFRAWHQVYAQLDASRVNNPDDKPGIELHFDVSTSPVVSINHGERSEFNLSDYTGQVRPGLLTFDSARQSGSSCSCRNQQNCISPLHGGFGRWTRHYDGGGGQSDFAGPIDGGLIPGATPAHEFGHHLGLAHGGPYRDRGNPFISPAAWDVDLNQKVVHVSIMNYSYSYNPGMTFSRGAYQPYPLPRLASDGSGLFGYLETLPTEGAVTTTPFLGYGGTGAGFTAGPTGCTGAGCVHSDFDRSGTFGGALTTGLSGSEVLLGAHNWVFQEGYYCPAEQVRANQTDGNGLCCRTGTRNAAGLCPTGSPPDGQGSTRTMMLAGKSATFAANGRLYSIFLDDLTPDPSFTWPYAPEARRTCSIRGAFTSPSCSGLVTARLRWAAIDGFSVPASIGNPATCATRDCVTPVSNPLGNLMVDGTTDPLPGAPSRFSGATQLAVTTLGSGSNQKVILAWATRRSGYNGGLRCADGDLPWCANDWGPLEVRYGNASTLEAAGVAVQGSTGTTLFDAVSTSDGAARGDHVSGVALAAWDPDDNGAPTRAMLVARVVGAPGRDDGELYWTMCDLAGCGQMQRLTSYVGGTTGPVVRSFTTIAAAVDHPSGGAPTLALVWGASSGTPDLADLRVLRMTPSPGAGAPFGRQVLNVVSGSAGARRALLESSVGLAFTSAEHGNRMILTAENLAQGDPVMFYWTATRAFDPIVDTSFILSTEVRNRWDYSRATVGNTTLMDGRIVALRAHAPGFVASLYQDDRPNVTGGDARINFFEGSVRAGVQHLGGFGPLFLLRPIVDSRLFESHRDYEEVNTLGYFLCPTIAAGSRGTAGPDLLYRGSPLGALRCQKGAAWGRNSGGLANLSNLTRACCASPCPRNAGLPDCYLSLITEYVTQPGMLAAPTPVPEPADTGLDISHYTSLECRSGAGAAASLSSPVLQ